MNDLRANLYAAYAARALNPWNDLEFEDLVKEYVDHVTARELGIHRDCDLLELWHALPNPEPPSPEELDELVRHLDDWCSTVDPTEAERSHRDIVREVRARWPH